MPVRDAVRRIASGVRNRRITRLQPMSTGWCRVREECLEAAEQNRIHGVRRFSLVTSGRALTGRELTRACDYYREMNGRGGIELCASMGLLGADELQILYDAGSGAITAIWRPLLRISPLFVPPIPSKTRSAPSRLRGKSDSKSALEES